MTHLLRIPPLFSQHASNTSHQIPQTAKTSALSTLLRFLSGQSTNSLTFLRWRSGGSTYWNKSAKTFSLFLSNNTSIFKSNGFVYVSGYSLKIVVLTTSRDTMLSSLQLRQSPFLQGLGESFALVSHIFLGIYKLFLFYSYIFFLSELWFILQCSIGRYTVFTTLWLVMVGGTLHLIFFSGALLLQAQNVLSWYIFLISRWRRP